jgi:hypothetical protein
MFSLPNTHLSHSEEKKAILDGAHLIPKLNQSSTCNEPNSAIMNLRSSPPRGNQKKKIQPERKKKLKSEIEKNEAARHNRWRNSCSLDQIPGVPVGISFGKPTPKKYLLS